MAKNSKIEWTEFNPWICSTCLRQKPLKWNKEAAEKSCRTRVFVSGDWLDDEISIKQLCSLLKLIHDTPNLDWLLSTKRPENFHKRISDVLNAEVNEEDDFMKTWAVTLDGKPGWALEAASWARIIEGLKVEAPPNVWIGTSAEDQARADERIPELLKIPAKVRFISCEPMLEEIDFEFQHGCRSCNHPGNIVMVMNESGRCSSCNGTGHEPPGIHWVIFGGESGPGARLCNVDWIRDGVRQCKEAGVAALVKQLGATVETNLGDVNWPEGTQGAEVYDENGKFVRNEIRLADKKGGDMAEWPESLRVREFPKY